MGVHCRSRSGMMDEVRRGLDVPGGFGSLLRSSTMLWMRISFSRGFAIALRRAIAAGDRCKLSRHFRLFG